MSLSTLFATHMVTANGDENHSFGGCAGCLLLLPFAQTLRWGVRETM